MNCSECKYVERRGSVLCCEIQQIPIDRISFCHSFKQFKEDAVIDVNSLYPYITHEMIKERRNLNEKLNRQ